MIDVIGTYFLFLAIYPVAIAMYAVDMPYQFAAWLLMGIIGVWILWRFAATALYKGWIALWLMPATIICGAATLLPLPFAVWMLFGPGRCATVGSILLCFALNVMIVFGAAALWRKARSAFWTRS